MKRAFIGLAVFNFCSQLVQAQPCQTGKLDPRVAVALRTVLADLPSSLTTSVEQIRAIKMKAPDFPKADVRYLTITADSIPLQVYNPAHATGLPIIISYHPGGFVTPILPFMAYEFWRQAKTYNALVFAVDYRVAPEHKYPAAVNDAYSAFKWVASNGHRYGGDTSRIVVLGLSAGGNLAAVVCQKAEKEGLARRIKLQILNCPSTDNPRNFAQHPSYQHYASGYFQTKAFCQYSIQAYAPDAALDNPEVAPLQSKRVSGLPPAVVITAEFDPLRDEGYAYAERLRNAGVPVRYHCFAGQIHCLVGLPADAHEHQEVDQLILTAMREVLSR
ncbi:alpha/beta hydrolase [Spirosoma utsteinense]|uniref:Acetyl esterase n=1 Tax=Spirosoma utsteinense TaxID=2585773 RepID=A0ABR6WAS0_9BACT|nr:alpha/beta hydrolase [Spirosoma utsteinense]MBC3787676.1 acetyl esterase [Spirosoma utsteinense]MBC3793273.1 acetyl esterase [Spirosoma utsteinense]